MDIELFFIHQIIFFPVILIASIITGTILIREVTKSNEWDKNYKKAFKAYFIWSVVSVLFNFLIQILFGWQFRPISPLIIPLGFYYPILFLIIIPIGFYKILGPFIIRIVYKTKFKESLIATLRFSFYQGIILFLCVITYFLIFSLFCV